MANPNSLRGPRPLFVNLARVGASMLLFASCSGDKDDPSQPEITTTTPVQTTETSRDIVTLDFVAACAEGDVTGVWLHDGDASGFLPFVPSEDTKGRVRAMHAFQPGQEVNFTGVDYGCGGTPEIWGANCKLGLTQDTIAEHTDQAGTITLLAECNNIGVGIPDETVVIAAELVE